MNLDQGVVVFFRVMTADGSLARAIHTTGRDIQFSHMNDDDYIIVDEEGHYLAMYPRGFVAAIMPLQTVGPGEPPSNANNPPLNS
jgi:hypothetical protein